MRVLSCYRRALIHPKCRSELGDKDEVDTINGFPADNKALEAILCKLETDYLQDTEGQKYSKQSYDDIVLQLEDLNHKSVEKLKTITWL
mmetsp:Transcript_11560/g.14449  ORF Transcript_11560/g.14449 Transcript_11560/m.14449 type:complete len:89 (+) Transcript_11560:214-480(+)